MSSSENLHIAAAGHGTRLQTTIDGLGFESLYPKHLLPTGNLGNETLLGRVTSQALDVTADPFIHANVDNLAAIATHPDVPSAGIVVLDTPDNAFGPFVRPLLEDRRRVLAASGDHYLDAAAWKDILDHHDSHDFPVTFAVAQGAPVDDGAVFDIDADGRIAELHRVRRTTEQQHVNIGLYVFEASDLVFASLASLGISDDTTRPLLPSPEDIARKLIERGLAGAYELPAFSAFNVNTPETYGALLGHTAIGIDQAERSA